MIIRARVKSRFLFAASLSAMSGLWAVPAFAQSAPPQDSTTAPDSAEATAPDGAKAAGPDQGLGDIVVTARRTAEKGQEVPVAVTALGTAALQRATILQSSDLQFKVPALTVSADILGGSASPNFAIRGLTQEFGTEPTVLVYFAEATADTRAVGNTLYDLSNVQVVRGAQGTLFGKNAIGGAVLLEPNRPTNTFGGSIQGRYGNYNAAEITGIVNVPVSEAVSLRLAGDLVRQDGTLHSLTGPDLNNRHHESVRGSLLLKPTDWLENYTVAQYFHLNQRGVTGILAGIGTCPQVPVGCVYAPGGPLGLDLPGILADQQKLGPYKVRASGLGVDRTRDRRVINTTTADAGTLTFKNIFSYSNTDAFLNKDLDATVIPLSQFNNNINDKIWTEEFQTSGKALSDRLKFIAGLYHSNDIRNQTLDAIILAPINPTNPVTRVARDKFTSTAVFAQATADLRQLLPGLEFTGGYRYSWDKRAEALLVRQFPTQDCALISPVSGTPFPNVDATCTRRLKRSFSASGYTYGLQYKIVPGVLAYVSRNRAYKAGGLNAFAFDPRYEAYSPEYVLDTEAGIKADWHIAGRPIRTNISLYHMRFTDIQLQNNNFYQGIGQSFTANGSAATLKGVEFEFNARPTTHLSVDGSLAFAKGRYSTFAVVSGTGDQIQIPAGQRFSYIPSRSVRFGANWELPLPQSIGRTTLSADYYYQSKEAGPVTHGTGPFNVIPAYGIVNMRLDVAGIGGLPVDASLYVKNLTNKAYVNNVDDDAAEQLFASRAYGDPRLYGIQLTYRF